MTTVQVYTPESVAPERWRQADHGLPDTSPYGLNRLSAAADIESVEFVVKSRRPTVAKLAPRNPDSGVIALTWEESGALLVPTSREFSRFVSGLIWATDRPLSRRQMLLFWLARRRLQQADAVWCLARGQVPVAREWLGPAPDLHFVPFGIDTDFFRQTAYPDQSTPPSILSAGVDRDRDAPALFRVLERVRAVHEDVVSEVQLNSDQPAPSFVSPFERLPHAGLRAKYERSSLVVIMTRPNSHASGMTVALEAQAVGRPVVIAGTSDMHDYVVDGVTGFIVEPDDVRGAAHRVLEILRNPAKGAEMGQQGARFVRDCRTSNHMTSALATLLR